MKIRRLHSWRVSVAQARQIQLRLRRRVSSVVPLGFDPQYVAGADVHFDRRGRGTRAFAAVVVLRMPHLALVEEVGAVVPVNFPYVPGYLSFREIPALARAWRRLRSRPDWLVVDGHGLAHPRRAGLACHAGLVFDLPTVGCAKSVLIGVHGPLGLGRGSWAALRDEGVVVGAVLRTRAGVRPVYVFVGHRMDLGMARRLILLLTSSGRFRLPEPIRRAHQLAGRLKSVRAGRVVSRRPGESE